MKRSLATPALILALTLTGLGIMHASHAQFAGTEPLTLTITPSYPKPYSTAIVVPESTVIDLSSSAVTVTVNGTVVSKGSGAEPAYVTVGGPGTTSTVTVTAVNGGQTYTRRATIRPADVALVVEATSTSHPFYEGGRLIASEGGVRLVAIPDLRTAAGSIIPAASLVYTWRNGEQILQGSSGIGKSVLTATSPVKYRDARITVTVATQDQSIVAEAAAVIAPSDPILLVYRNDPLLGPLYGTALPRNVRLSGTEESFRAVPYFFGEKPAVTWTVNNTTSDTDADITVRSTGGGSGTATVGVSAVSPSAPQPATASLSVRFGEENAFNFFGL